MWWSLTVPATLGCSALSCAAKTPTAATWTSSSTRRRKPTLFDIGAIRHELGKLLGVPVDVLTPNALPDNFRATVLAQARPV